MSHHPGTSFFTSLMAFLFLAFVGVAIAGYALGWLTVERTPQQTTIEIDTQKVEEAASDAKHEGEALLQKAGETLRESGEALEETVEPNRRESSPDTI